MRSYILKRSTSSFISLLILLIAVFIISRLSGDPTDLYLPIEASEETRQEFREFLGFDRPIVVQLLSYAGDVARLDFGESTWRHEPVVEIVIDRLPFTLILATATLIVAALIGITLGMAAALRQGSVIDRVANWASIVGTSVPDFWVGLILIVILAQNLGWFPTSGSGGWRYFVLPMLALLGRPVGTITQVTRTAVLQQLNEEYLVTARAKGVSQSGVVLRHVLRNAMVPVLTIAGDQFIHLGSGVIVIETVFGLPGLGKLVMDAVSNRDFALLQAAVFFVAVLIFVVNFVIDMAYAALDPRIRFR